MFRLQSWMIIALMFAGCAQNEPLGAVDQGNLPASEPAWASTGDRDVDVVATALLELLSNDHATYRDEGERAKIVISNMTNGSNSFLSPDQLRAEWKDFDPPADAVRSLTERNQTKQKVEWSLPADRFVISDLKGISSALNNLARVGDRKFEEAYPDAAVCASMWLPGYSQDGKTALVRFSFGPTEHGATASYLLKRRADGTWKIVSRKLAYYA